MNIKFFIFNYIIFAISYIIYLFSSLNRLKPRNITLIVMFVGIISTIIGDYSYALLLPVTGILYKYIGRSSSLGILTMFIAITIGYGTGLIYNYQAYQLGDITEVATSSIVSGYNYELLSNIFLLIASTIILTVVGAIVLEKFAKKYRRNEETDNLNVSSKAAKITLIAFIVMALLLVYWVIPGLPLSGILLDKTEPTYIGKLFGSASSLSQGFMVLIIVVLMICGLIYGKVSKNIKNSGDYSRALTKSFENTGYVFVLLFFASILYEVIDWTNIATVISTNIIDFVGSTQISGIILLIIAFLSIVVISIFIPVSSNISRTTASSNVSPSFTPPPGVS